MESCTDIANELRRYAEQYRQPPTGREIAGTPELLEKAANECA